MEPAEGHSAKGIFGGSATGGRAFASYRASARKVDAVSRFAKLIAQHGDVREVAKLMGITYPNACKLMSRITKDLNADVDLGWTPADSAHCRDWAAKS